MNTQDANIHTNEIKEYRETAQQLSDALHIVVKEYNGSPNESGIKSNKDGSYEIFIDKGPTLWFKDEVELASWVMGVNNSD